MSNLRESEIKKFLEGFRKRTDIICSTLFTKDGLIIAVDQAIKEEDSDCHQSIGALYAGVISLAESGVDIIHKNYTIRQLLYYPIAYINFY